MTTFLGKVERFQGLDLMEQEVVRRVINRLSDEILSKEARTRVDEVTGTQAIIPPATGARWLDYMLPEMCKQQPYAMAQAYIELRERIIEILYREQGEDLEEEVEQEIRREEKTRGWVSTHQ